MTIESYEPEIDDRLLAQMSDAIAAKLIVSSFSRLGCKWVGTTQLTM